MSEGSPRIEPISKIILAEYIGRKISLLVERGRG
jgi:hypothetical protein